MEEVKECSAGKELSMKKPLLARQMMWKQAWKNCCTPGRCWVNEIKSGWKKKYIFKTLQQ